MKIMIQGFSGSGKSTLARRLGEYYSIPVLHLDTVQFNPGWQIRPQEEKLQLVADFLAANDSWVIDGNYSALHLRQRLEEADLVIMLLFNRLNCLLRVTRRYKKYRGTSRPDMTPGCSEKLDGEFVWWILHKGRTGKTKERFKARQREYAVKTVVLKNQRQLDKWMAENIPTPG